MTLGCKMVKAKTLHGPGAVLTRRGLCSLSFFCLRAARVGAVPCVGLVLLRASREIGIGLRNCATCSLRLERRHGDLFPPDTTRFFMCCPFVTVRDCRPGKMCSPTSPPPCRSCSHSRLSCFRRACSVPCPRLHISLCFFWHAYTSLAPASATALCASVIVCRYGVGTRGCCASWTGRRREPQG